jgi:hypothetical protein
MHYTKPEILTTTCARRAIQGSLPKATGIFDQEHMGTVGAYEADE